MSRKIPSDKAVVDRARRALAGRGKIRWVMLLYALLFLGLCGYITMLGIQKVENLDGDQLSVGFVYGLMLAIVWAIFGVPGAVLLGKVLLGYDGDGLSGDFRTKELLVRYYDRLREMRELPDEKIGEPDGPANGSQPLGPDSNRLPGAAGSRR